MNIVAAKYEATIVYDNSFYIGENPVHSTLALTKIYPIGWSKDGKFSMVSHYPSDESGEDKCFLKVIDLVTDSLLCDLNLVDVFLREKTIYDVKSKEPISDYWEVTSDTIFSILSTYGIVQSDDFQLKQFPMNVADGQLFFKSYKTQSGKRVGITHFETWCDTPLTFDEYQLIHELHSIAGKKIIYKYPSNDQYWYEMTLGYLKSPFENRIVILDAWSRRWSCGGPPANTFVHLIGGDLDTGFK